MIDLTPYNTFGIQATALHYVTVSTARELLTAIRDCQSNGEPYYILGRGANVLFTENFQGTIIHIEMPGITMVDDAPSPGYCIARAGAGVELNSLTEWSAQQQLIGIEALAGIPSSVGASVVQNVGAYGQEIADTLHRVLTLHLPSGNTEWIVPSPGMFGYRYSPFKGPWRGERYVLAAEFKLTHATESLPGVQARCGWDRATHGQNSAQATRERILALRAAKLPSIDTLGSAGSFFKNPTLTEEKARALQTQYPTMPLFHMPDGSLRASAGWLIEQCGWKGHREGDAGVYPKQALVLVNYGNATGREIYQLSQRVAQSVRERFDITLQREVILLGEKGEINPL